MTYQAKLSGWPGVVGDKGPEGEQGPPGHSAVYELGKNEPTGAVVLMPQEFDADNVQAYIQQEIEAGIKEHQTELMRKVADVLADTLVEERKAAKDAAHEASCRAKSLRAYLDAHRLEAEEFDKKRALDIAELQLKVHELEVRMEEKTKETKILRSKLHAVSISKPVRKVKRRKYDSQGQDTPKPGAGG